MPKVTIVMPVYNSQRFLEKAVESVLNQTYMDFELLIIDNASTDNSLEIAKNFSDNRIKILKNDSNMGVAYTRNRGIREAKGEYIALMDSDDITTSFRIEKEVEFLDNNPDIIVVGGCMQMIDEEGNPLGPMIPQLLNPNYIKAFMILNNTMVNGSTMFRKKIVIENNILYLDKQYGVEDYRFWCELLQFGEFANINELFLYYRIVNTGLSIENIKNKENRNKAFDKIHEFNFETFGFEFSNKEKKILLKVFQERGIINSKADIEILYGSLKNMVFQAEKKGLSNKEEIKIMCRKRFGEKIAQAQCIW